MIAFFSQRSEQLPLARELSQGVYPRSMASSGPLTPGYSGPLTLERYVKDDGRALILYARAQAPGDVSAPREELREEKGRQT